MVENIYSPLEHRGKIFWNNSAIFYVLNSDEQQKAS